MIRRVEFNRKHNPSYFSIIDKHNEIMSEWNRINGMLHDFKCPNLFPLFQRKRLLPITKSLKELQVQFIAWNKSASSMLINPELRFPHGPDSETNIQHYLNVLRDMRNRLDSNMNHLVDDYRWLDDDISVKLNFFIAIAAFLVSLAALIIGIITFRVL